MQSVRERPSDPWIGMIGWVGLCWIRSFGLWMAGGCSRLLGATMIVGLERVKPVVVVSQRAFLLYIPLDGRPSTSVGLDEPSNERDCVVESRASMMPMRRKDGSDGLDQVGRVASISLSVSLSIGWKRRESVCAGTLRMTRRLA